MTTIKYIDPLFQELLDKIPAEKRRESELSYSIARRLNEVLARKGWTQADLARATGKLPTLISRWMSGTHNFTIQTLAEIETALGEEIVSIRRYRRPSEAVSGFGPHTYRAAYLNSGSKKK